jgi:putative flippase GtrA
VSGLTFGFLVNQIWSFAGDENRGDVNQMFFQPFFAKNFKSGAGLGVNAEITSNWKAHTTLATLNPIMTAVTKIGGQMISMAVGPRIPLSGPDESRAKLGLRGVLTFVFPK